MSIGVTSKKYFFFHFHTIIIFKDVLKVKACLSHMKFLFNYISPEHNVHFHNRPLSLSLSLSLYIYTYIYIYTIFIIKTYANKPV